MFLLFVFSLVSLSDPLSILAGGGSVIATALSPITPLQSIIQDKDHHQYNIPHKSTTETSIPTTTTTTVNQNNGNKNQTQHVFREDATSAPSSSRVPMKESQLEKSLYLSPAVSSTQDSFVVPHVQLEDSIHKSLQEKTSETSQVLTQNSPSSVSPENERTYRALESSDIPLLLKFDREYTPAQIAEYIFDTGDEKGFVQGVAEMIEDGQIMASRDDVILFLEAVQDKLDKMKRIQQN